MSEFLLTLVPIAAFVLLILFVLIVNSVVVFGAWSLILAIPALVFIVWCLIKLTLLFKQDTKFKV